MKPNISFACKKYPCFPPVKTNKRKNKTPVLDSFFIKVAGLQSCNFIKKSLQHSFSPVNIAKFSRTTFFVGHFRWLLLQVLYKEAVLEKFVNFTRTCHYRSPFLKGCRPITCNFVKIESPVEAFCRQLCEISQSNFEL